MKKQVHIDQIGEFALIEQLAGFLPKTPKGVLGIGDDAAVLPYSKDKYMLLTTDMMAQDVHFTLGMDPVAVGHKALACNISDIAAMGGRPTYAVVSIGLPAKVDSAYIKNIYKGIGATAKTFGVSIVGGDTIKSDKVVVNIALLGLVNRKHCVTRRGAKSGDWVFVSGPLGGSFDSGRHLSFTPRVEEARYLVRKYKPSAMIDISDGLAGDLNHILDASQVGVKLWHDAVPLNHGVELTRALTDGEDYEILFTLDARQSHELVRRQFNKKKFSFYPIGEIIADKKQRVNAKSFTHF